MLCLIECHPGIEVGIDEMLLYQWFALHFRLLITCDSYYVRERDADKIRKGESVLFEILTTGLMGGIALKAFQKHKGLSSNDSGKIQRIMSLSGLNVRDGKDTLTTQLVRKKQYEWGWEYKYRIPLGRSFADYESTLQVFEDGLNNRRKHITFNDLKQLDIKKDLLLATASTVEDKTDRTKGN
ncbi:hypothetical protein [Lysinibacillus irui]|uniref:hypothetical protein n=1 Tax=Lysinibacillus irui TaxID=2998077 RepID=UPI002AD4226E|nr:hypothetical protein [Lysinibacillus irui]MEA0565689.1 hypothetical protein [Lysinibacillus irui]